MNNIDRAVAFAAHAHRHQMRKSTDIPYVSHPVAAALMLCQVGAPEHLVVAALLHDTIEDTDTSESALRGVFGDEVTEIVLGCSEPDKSLPWEDRKRHTVAYLASAPVEIQLVSCADKVHNLRCLEADLDMLGAGAWARFKRGKEQQGWYYQGLVASLDDLSDSELGREMYCEMCEIVARIWG